MRHWLEGTFAAFGTREFRVLWFGTLFSFLAFFMSTIVQSVVAFELTGDNGAVGFVVFAQGLAMLLLGPFGGAFADRWPKRRVVAVAQSITFSVFVTLAFMVATNTIQLLALAAGSLVMGCTIAFMGPARQALVIDLVPEAVRGNAMALSQVANSASRVVGPALAGLLLAWAVSGATGAYATMAAFYAVSVASLILLPRSRVRADVGETRVLADVAAGLRYVAGHERLRLLIALFVAVIMTGFPYVTVLPGLVEHQLGHEAQEISLLYLVTAVGALTASLTLARYADSRHAVRIFASMGFLFGLALLGLSQVPSYEVAVAWMIVIGVTSGGFQSLSGAVIVRVVEPGFIGRVMSLTMLAFAGFGLMGLPIGLLADELGERTALAFLGGAVCVIVGVLGPLAARRARTAPEGPAPGYPGR